MDYGTGAMFGVPGARPARPRVRHANTACRSRASSPPSPEEAGEPVGDEAYTGAGVLVNSPLPRRPERRRRRSAEVIAPRRGGRLGRGHDRLAAARLGRLAPALLGHADPDHPLRRLRAGAGAAATSCRSCCPRMSASTFPATRSTAIRPGSTSTARTAAARRGARPTRSTPSSIRPGISSASPASRRTGRSTGRSPSAGCRSTNISAGSSMRSCTCSTPASGPARCSGSAGSTSPSRSPACSPRAW